MSRLFVALLLVPALALGRQTTFTWDNNGIWPEGTTVELKANGVSASGITGNSHTLDVPLESDRRVDASARAVAPDGSVSAWARSIAYLTATPLVQIPNKAAVVFGGTSMALPAGWTSQDIGTVGFAGSAEESGGTYTVKGSGADIFVTADAFHFAYLSLSGDCTITARIVSFSNSVFYTKAGVMIRATTDANSINAISLVVQGQGPRFQYRSTTGGSTTARGAGAAATFPVWVRLVRSGNSFTAYNSANGSTWTKTGTPVSVSMSSAVLVGLAVTSHDDSKLTTALFDNVTITTPAGPVSLDGAASTVVSASSGLSVSGGGTAVSLASAAIAMPSASGTLSTQIPMSAAAAAVVSSNGQLGLSVTLAGSALTHVLASGELFEAGSASLSGAASVVAGATGNIGLSLLISGSALVDALAQGDLLSSLGLSADASGRVSATGDLAALGAGALGGSAGVVVGATGNLGMGIPIQGNAVGRVTADGDMTNLAPITGSATVTAVGGGLLQVTINAPLSADAQAVVNSGGSLSMTIPLSGNAVAVALATGTLSGGAVAWMPSPTRTWTPGYVPRIWHPPAMPRVWRVS